MAQWTGLEPATPGVTGRYSNQLNYHCAFLERLWWVMTGSNRRPSACKADALPAELITLVSSSGAYDRHKLTNWQALNCFISIFKQIDVLNMLYDEFSAQLLFLKHMSCNFTAQRSSILVVTRCTHHAITDIIYSIYSPER